MNNRWLRLAMIGCAISMGQAAWSAKYYVSDCQPGAAAGCIAGDDSNNGRTKATAWRTTAKVQQVFADLKADDKILFARGGVWVDSAMYLQNFKSSAAHPITIDAYFPSWGATRRPILKETRKDMTAISFSDGGEPEEDGGYVVRNLDLRGGGVAFSGISASQETHDIVLTDLNIQGFAIGVYCGFAIQRITLRDSTLRDSTFTGVLWSCNNSLIENNLFDNNGTTPGFDHSIYIEGAPYGGPTNLVIRRNTLINNVMIEGKCSGVPLVVHGQIDGLTIEHNLIQQDSGTSTAGCWGIAVDSGFSDAESFKRVVIRGNHVVNVGGIGIGCSACIAPVIENNAIISSDPLIDDFIGIAVPDRPRGPDDTADTGAIVRNNSIYFAATPWSAVGIWVASNQGSLPGKNLQVVSNLIRFGAGNPGSWCFNLTGTRRADFTAFDNNLCHHEQGNGRYSDAYPTLADAKEAGFDRHGSLSDPKIAAAPSQANDWSLALGAGSPARDAGHASRSAASDILSVLRVDPDIGAYEYVPPPTR